MSNQSQGSMVIVGAIAAGIAFVTFVALMILGGFGFSPALVLSVGVAALAAIVLFRGFHADQAVNTHADAPRADPPRPHHVGPEIKGETAAALSAGDATQAQRTAVLVAGDDAPDDGPAKATPPTTASAAATDATGHRAHVYDSPPVAAPAPMAASDHAPGDPAPQVAPHPGATGASEVEARPDLTKMPVAQADAGTAPVRLDAPRDGQADDLKRIKGIGPRMEEMLHGLGFYHFDQVADWTPDEVAWVDANLDGFNGRVDRDDWVAQAKLLRDGSNTDFSRQVESDNPYRT